MTEAEKRRRDLINQLRATGQDHLIDKENREVAEFASQLDKMGHFHIADQVRTEKSLKLSEEIPHEFISLFSRDLNKKD